MTGGGDQEPSDWTIRFAAGSAFVGLKELAAGRCQRRERDVHRELALKSVTDMGSGRAHRHPAQCCETRLLLGGDWLGAASSRQDGDPVFLGSRKRLPHALK